MPGTKSGHETDLDEGFSWKDAASGNPTSTSLRSCWAAMFLAG
jgi:hypothetical protein